MTVFVVDTSHYDGDLSLALLRRWRALGLAGLTHKIGEGLANDDPLDGTVLARARDAGFPVLGGYFIPHQGVDPVREAARCVELADRDESWWREFPAWLWQIDAERWSATDRVSAAEIDDFADALTVRSGGHGRIVLYASRGQYHDDLAGLRWPLWNADYGSELSYTDPWMIYRALAGDLGRGWTKYSGQVPLLWQFTSRATLAGQTTCDVSAWCGSEAELIAWASNGGTIGGMGGAGMTLGADDLTQIKSTIWYTDLDTGERVLSAGTALLGMHDQVEAMHVKVDALMVTVAGLTAAGGVTGQVAALTDAQLASALRKAADELDPPAALAGG